MDQNLIIESTVAKYILDINDVVYFLESASNKGRVNFVCSTLKIIRTELYWESFKNLEENRLNVSKKLLKEKVESIVEIHFSKYYEKAIVVKMSNTI